MKERFQDLIELYISAEKLRVEKEVDKQKKGTLEDFAFFLDTRKDDTLSQSKGKLWNIKDITKEDAKAYYKFLMKSGKGGRERGLKIEIIDRFMDFLVKEGSIKSRPWKELSERKEVKPVSRMNVSEEKKKTIIKYLEKLTLEDLFEKRDKAILLLLLDHRLEYSEISNLNMEDVKESFIIVKTRFRNKTKEIELSDGEKRALYGYLFTRLKFPNNTGIIEGNEEGEEISGRGEVKEKDASDEEPLFLGTRNLRISPRMIRQILRDYMELTEEE